jgi:methionyl-tRNA synthetase
VRSDRARAAVATRTALNLVRLSAISAWNVIPTLAEAVLAAFDSKEAVPAWPSEPAISILADKAGQPISPIGPLLEKITHDEIDRLQQMFGGTGAQNLA